MKFLLLLAVCWPLALVVGSVMLAVGMVCAMLLLTYWGWIVLIWLCSLVVRGVRRAQHV